jgi:hypothetical protein
MVKEQLAKLLNIMASRRIGRDYMLQSHDCVRSLLSLAKEEGRDSLTRRCCIGTFQKLSIR